MLKGMSTNDINLSENEIHLKIVPMGVVAYSCISNFLGSQNKRIV